MKSKQDNSVKGAYCHTKPNKILNVYASYLRQWVQLIKFGPTFNYG